MQKILIGILAIVGLSLGQTIKSNLNGMRIYMQRNDGGHEDGYLGMKNLLMANQALYNYTFEYSPQALGDPELNALFNRLYKGDGKPKAANTIDIMIFCQGEGDGNLGRGDMDNAGYAVGMYARQKNLTTHIRSGGGFMMVHAAGGREVSWYRWGFGARLITDWFLDGTNASVSYPGNSGHFSSGTPGTAALDDETLAAHDSSAYFVRNLFSQPKTKGGYGQPLSNSQVLGEWYHFNGGMKYEDGTGGPVSNPRNTFAQKTVRGDPGVPDSGIGPVKIFSVLTKIGPSYIPPGKGRVSVWGREVSKGPFNPAAAETNGRFIYFQPGHTSTEWTQAGGWMGDLFLSTLRWVAKDDRGCVTPGSPAFSPMATINTCIATGIGGSGQGTDESSSAFGRVTLEGGKVGVFIDLPGSHTLNIQALNGETVFMASGTGPRYYLAPWIAKGTYLVQVASRGETFRKQVSLP